jgi:glucose-1-phosphate adenylyltransferase
VGAVVRDSIIMFDSVIRQGAIIDRAILDKEVMVGQGAVVGDGPDGPPNRQEAGRLNTGITVVGKRAMIPRGQRIGRNVKIGGGVRAADFHSRNIRSGDSVVRAEDVVAVRTTAKTATRPPVTRAVTAETEGAAG